MERHNQEPKMMHKRKKMHFFPETSGKVAKITRAETFNRRGHFAVCPYSRVFIQHMRTYKGRERKCTKARSTFAHTDWYKGSA